MPSARRVWARVVVGARLPTTKHSLRAYSQVVRVDPGRKMVPGTMVWLYGQDHTRRREFRVMGVGYEKGLPVVHVMHPGQAL